MENAAKVVVTGVTGFLGSHTAIQLLKKGYHVTGTLRDLARADQIRSVIAEHAPVENLAFEEASLSDTTVWKEILAGKDYVIHIASPFPRVLPKREEDLIGPARDGALNVLRASAENGVKRVVMTSSTGAIVYGRPKDQRDGMYTEKDWTDVTNRKDTTPYFRSKTIAEKSAWEFIGDDDSGLELTVICPGAILGPVLEEDFGTSANIVIKTMDGSSPAIPKIGFDMVDVRSVAELHILAMESPSAAGERFIGSAGFLSFKEVASILREAYPDKKIPRRELPNFMTRFVSMIDGTLKPILIDLSVKRTLDNSKARNQLGWDPISPKDAVLACAESVIRLSLV